MFPSATGYGWNGKKYYDLETGRFVSKQAVRDSLENVIDLAGAKMNTLSQQLNNGEISLADWQRGMMNMIKQSHTASAALEKGGWAQMTKSDWGSVGQLVKEQYNFLRDFAKEIANGTQALDGRLLVRADMYADASNGTYWEMSKKDKLENGYDEGRRVLESGADHCDDCLEYANDGWMPIDEIPEIGNSQCLTRCRCEIEYRISGEPNSETG